MNIRQLGGVMATIGMLGAAGHANAIAVTATSSAATLEAALLGSGITPTSFSVSGHSSGSALSTGTFTNGSGTYGITSGIVLSTGDVADYSDGPNTEGGKTTSYGVLATAAQQALLGPISGQSSHYDVTEIDIAWDGGSGGESIFWDVVFGSDEYAEYVGSSFIDAFGIFLNGVNIAFEDGLPINIDHPDMGFTPTGTELDGILDPDGSGTSPAVMKFSGTTVAGTNTLKFIIADSGDSALDSTVYIAGLGDTEPPTIPTPGSVLLLALGLLALRFRHRA